MTRTAKFSDVEQIDKMIRIMCIEIESMGGHEVSIDEAVWQNFPDKVFEWLKKRDQNLVVLESGKNL